MPRAHCVFLIQQTYGSQARKKPWACGVYGGGRQLPRSEITDSCLSSAPTTTASVRGSGIVLLSIYVADGVLMESSGSPSEFYTHFQKFIASKRQKIMTRIVFYWIKHFNVFLISLSTQLFKNITIYKYGGYSSKNSQCFHVLGDIKMKINGRLS